MVLRRNFISTNGAPIALSFLSAPLCLVKAWRITEDLIFEMGRANRVYGVSWVSI